MFGWPVFGLFINKLIVKLPFFFFSSNNKFDNAFNIMVKFGKMSNAAVAMDFSFCLKNRNSSSVITSMCRLQCNSVVKTVA